MADHCLNTLTHVCVKRYTLNVHRESCEKMATNPPPPPALIAWTLDVTLPVTFMSCFTFYLPIFQIPFSSRLKEGTIIFRFDDYIRKQTVFLQLSVTWKEERASRTYPAVMIAVNFHLPFVKTEPNAVKYTNNGAKMSFCKLSLQTASGNLK